MTAGRYVLFVLLLLTGGAALANPDPASPSARARVLYDDGMKQYNLAHFTEALRSFEEAYLIKPDPTFLFDLGQCHRQLGHPKEAAYSYRRYLGERPDAPNKADVERFIADAEVEIRRQQASVGPTGPIPPAPAETPRTAAPAATGPAAAAATVVESKPPEPAVIAPAAPAPEAQPASNGKWWILGGVAAVVVVAAAVGIAVAASGGDNPPFATKYAVGF